MRTRFRKRVEIEIRKERWSRKKRGRVKAFIQIPTGEKDVHIKIQEDMTKESFAITEADLGIRSEDTHQFIKAGSGLKKITKEEIFTDEK